MTKAEENQIIASPDVALKQLGALPCNRWMRQGAVTILIQYKYAFCQLCTSGYVCVIMRCV